MVVAPYTVRPFELADEDRVLTLLRLSLGEGPEGGRQQSYWRWKHLHNPFGPSYARLACGAEDELVGLRAFMQWAFKSQGTVLRAVRAVDTATHPGYRRQGIFSLLTRQVLEDVQQDGVDMVFNTPNNDVLPGYLKLGWQYVATVRPLIKVLNYPGFSLGMVRSRLGHQGKQKHPVEAFFRREPVAVSSIIGQGVHLETLLSQDAGVWDSYGGLRTPRSLEYLGWRYGEHPTIPYWAAIVEEGGRLQGCAIFRTNTRYGLKEVLITELLLARPEARLCRTLLEQVRSCVRADYLITYFPQDSFHRRQLEGWGFRAVPRWGMNLTVKPLRPELPVDPMHLPNWALTLGDLELF